MIRCLFFCVLIAYVLGCSAALAADTVQKLRTIETELSKQKYVQSILDEKARVASDSLRDLQHKLILATEALQEKAAEAQNLEDGLEELGKDIATRRVALGYERKRLSDILNAVLELVRQPLESLLLHSQLTNDYVRRAILLRALVPRLKSQAAIIAQDLADFAAERTKMLQQQSLVADAQKNIRAQRHELDQLIAVRRGLLDRTDVQKQDIARQLAALTSEAKDLRQLLEKVAPKRSTPSAVNPRALRGSLRPPVAGHLVRGYGVKDSDGVTSQGLTYMAPSGSPVVAPSAGKVVFAGAFKGYGKIVILQHGGGYHSFLAGFDRIDADMGQEVEAGEPLGVLPVRNSGRPELYFEWRYNTEPVDPSINH
jgi:septal ring factor EnvC (AmiA/AmiB activator)